MSTEKIINNKKINQNTGAIINASSCGVKKTKNIFSIGLSNFGQCGYYENNLPIVDLNGSGYALDMPYFFTQGDEPSYIIPDAIIKPGIVGDIRNIEILTSGYGVDSPDEQVEFGPNVFLVNVTSSGTYIIGSTNFLIDYNSLSKSFFITKNGGGAFPFIDAQNLLRSFVYWNNSIAPAPYERTFTIFVNDGKNTNLPATAFIEIINS